MKALKLLLFMFLSLFNLGQASKLAAPAEMLVMYNAYALDFFTNGAKRTLGPNLGDKAQVTFGTFVSHVWSGVTFPKNDLYFSRNPEYSKATLSQITKYLGDVPKYATKSLLQNVNPLPKSHRAVLEKLTEIVQSTRGSNAPGFSDKWNAYVPGFKQALAGTKAARISEMYSVGLKPLFDEKFSPMTLQSSPFPVLDTDVTHDRANWGLTLANARGQVGTVGEWKTWYVGMRNSDSREVRQYLAHRKITTSITRSLSELESLDTCK